MIIRRTPVSAVGGAFGEPRRALGGEFNPEIARAPFDDGRRTVYCVATGAALVRHMIDCRELVAAGEYTWAPPTPTP